MGLDMYLEKTKKIEGMTLRQILDTYDNVDAKKNGYTLNEWCGKSDENVCEDREAEVLALEHESHPAWAWEKDYTRKGIEECIAYWRKANQIHNWFVENVQDGEDDCGLYEVTKDQLQELLYIAKAVDNHPSTAGELLPTISGFFFGSTNYDKFYFDDIKETIEQLTKVLNETDFDNYHVYYSSSW